MIIDRNNLALLGRSFRTLAMESLDGAEPQWGQVAMEVPSTTTQNDYGWLNDVPGMREWLDEREVANLSSSDYSIKNREFELTVGVKRPHIEDDNLGQYNPMFRMLGQAVADHPDQLVFELLKNGFTELCYDKLAFFAVSHKLKVNDSEKTFSNKGTKTLTRSEFRSALALMRKITNRRGRSLRSFQRKASTKPLLVIGPDNDSTATEIVGLSTLSTAGANPDFGAANILVCPDLVDAAAPYWFLLDTSFPVRPLILQRRKQPEFVAKDSLTDDNVFYRNEYHYGFDDRKNVGFGFWQLAFGSTGATAGA